MIDTYTEVQAKPEFVALVVGARHAPWRIALCKGLEHQGYRVMVATNTERALSRFERHRGPIQIVVVGGGETAWSIRRLARRINNISPTTRVVAV